MSANNQLIIIKKGIWFEVHENICVDNEFFPCAETLRKRFKSLESAIKFANKYCSEYPYVEYGYRIDNNCLK